MNGGSNFLERLVTKRSGVMDDTYPHVATKLLPPLFKKQYLRREHLLQQLQENLDKKLIVLCAGAGYGKTTLLSSLVQTIDYPWVWLSLDNFDADWAVFLHYVCAGLREKLPWIEADALVIPESLEKSRVLLGRLVSELSKMDEELVLILDDFHEVDGSDSVAVVMNFLLRYAPSRSHLIISGRWCPHLRQIPRLQAHGEVFQLDQKDLRFSPAETYRLFRKSYGLGISPGEAAALTRDMEGWPLSLNLACQSYRWVKEADRQVVPAARQQELFEFLVYDVLYHEPPVINDFLQRSSILARMSPSLCDAVLGIDRSARFLEDLVRRNIFTERLEGKERWYCYHQEFRQCLQKQLALQKGTREIRALHHRAGRWFEERGEWNEAVHHYTRAESYDDAARIVESVGEEMLGTGRLETLSGWLDGFPPGFVATRAELLFLRGRTFQLLERFEEALEAHLSARRLFGKQNDRDGQAKALSQIGLAYYNLGDYQTAWQTMEQAVEELGQDKNRYPEVLVSLGLICADLRSITAGAAFIEEAAQIYQARGDVQDLVRPLYYLASLRTHAGDLESALSGIQRSKMLHQMAGLDERLLCRILNVMGQIQWLRGDFTAALLTLREAQEIAQRYALTMLHSWITLAMGNVYRDKGNFPQAQSCYDQALRLSEEANHPNTTAEVMNDISWLKLLAGHPQVARRWGERALSLVGSEKTSYYPFILVSLGAIAGELCDFEGAMTRLRQGIEVLDRVDERIGLVGAELHLAHLCYLMGNAAQGNVCLETGLAIGEKGGFYTFPFWHPRVMAALCARAVAGDIHADYAASLIARRLGATAVEYLLPLLRSEDETVLRRAIGLLAAVGDGRSIAPLQRLAMTTGSDVIKGLALAAVDRVRERYPALEIPSALRVHCLGPLRVYRGEAQVTAEDWRRGKGATLKAQALLAYLLVRGEAGASREELMELLWPGELDMDRVTNRFHNTLHALRRALEPNLVPGKASGYIVCRNERYRINPLVFCWVDADAFEAHYRRGKRLEEEGRGEDALVEYSKAEEYYGGDYLHSLPTKYTDVPDDDWCLWRRYQLQDMHLDVLLSLARLYEQRGNDGLALTYARRVLVEDGSCEEAQRIVVDVLRTA